MIKSAKNMKMRKKKIHIELIAYLSSWRSSLFIEGGLERIFSFLGTKFLFPCQRLILPYYKLSFPYPGLSLRGVRDLEVGKFVDNIVLRIFLIRNKFPIWGGMVG